MIALKFLLALGLFQVVNGLECTTAGTTEITPGDESDQGSYDQATEKAKLDDKGDVLGFSLVTIQNPNYSETPVDPCLKLKSNVDVDTDEGNHKILVLAQPYPLGQAYCVDSDIDGFAKQCTVNEFKWCNDGVEEMSFQFSCDQQSCEMTENDIYVKVVMSDSALASDIEYWCDSTNDTYPSSLIVTKPANQKNYTGKDTSQDKEEKKKGGSVALQVSALCLMLSPLLITWFF